MDGYRMKKCIGLADLHGLPPGLVMH